MQQPLPKFTNPPVVEVALSVQFDRLDISVVQLSLLWQQFRERFPVVQEKPEIDAVFEKFGTSERKAPGVRFEVVSMPMPRFWFVDKAGIELVQIQRDRFVRNWRKTEAQPEYPSYDKIRNFFVEDWERFTKFVNEECNTPLVPNQCEVTYVNAIEHVDAGQLSNTLAWVSGSCSDEYLGDPEDTELTLRYLLKDDSDKPWGRLHIVAASVIQKSDGKRIVRLNLTARGEPRSPDTEGVLATLDAGHESVVCGFASITTPELHEVWGRTS